jgi:hypothetical protein
VLAIVDQFTKESLGLMAAHDISGQYVVGILELAAQFRGLPLAIRTDQGPYSALNYETLTELAARCHIHKLKRCERKRS